MARRLLSLVAGTDGWAMAMGTSGREVRLEFSLARLALCLALAIVALVAANAAAHLFADPVVGARNVMKDLFILDQERNIPTFYSVLLISCNVVVLCRIAFNVRYDKDRDWYYWLFLTFIFVFLVIDEWFSFHERLARPMREGFGLSGPFFFGWVIPGSLFAATVALGFTRFLIRLEPISRAGMTLAGAVFVSGTLGMEMIDGWYFESIGRNRQDLGYIALTTIEETLELVGMSLMLLAVLRFASLRFGGVRLSSPWFTLVFRAEDAWFANNTTRAEMLGIVIAEKRPNPATNRG